MKAIWRRSAKALSIVGTLAVSAAGTVLYGAARWRWATRDRRRRLDALRIPSRHETYDPCEIEGLPPSVRRYFRAALTRGQPIVTGVRLSQVGSFRTGAGQGWRPFRATQVVSTRPPGFDWDARIRMAPGLGVLVHDSYVAGSGMLRASALGLVTIADLHGTPELAEGELQRYLAEAVWYPTALLPSQGVHWEEIDASRARATLSDGPFRASLEFEFDDDGLVASVYAPDRWRADGDAFERTPWQGRYFGYTLRGGMQVPLEAEVEWHLPEGLFPYWRGQISEIGYELTR